MVYKRRFKKRRYKKKGRMSLNRRVKKIMDKNSEKQYYSFGISASNLLQASPSNTVVSNIAQGTGFDNRVGNQLKPFSMKVLYQCELNASVQPRTAIRFMIIQTLANGQPNGLPTNTYHLNPSLSDASNKYKILYDRTHQLSAGVSEMINRTFSLRNLRRITFDENTTVARFGQVFVYVLTDNGVANGVSFRASTRIHYTNA